MDTATFQATIYRDLRFDADGGGRVTLQFDEQQVVTVIRLLTMRSRLLEVTIRVVEGYGKSGARTTIEPDIP